MSQKKIHLNNRKLRRELERQMNLNMPLHVWAQIVKGKFQKWPHSWYDKVFKILPRRGDKCVIETRPQVKSQ